MTEAELGQAMRDHRIAEGYKLPNLTSKPNPTQHEVLCFAKKLGCTFKTRDVAEYFDRGSNEVSAAIIRLLNKGELRSVSSNKIGWSQTYVYAGKP